MSVCWRRCSYISLRFYLGDHLRRDELGCGDLSRAPGSHPAAVQAPSPDSLCPRLDVEALKVEMEYLRGPADQPARSRSRPQSRKRGNSARDRGTHGSPWHCARWPWVRRKMRRFLERVEMISPSSLGLADSMGMASMDLLRIEDMARAQQGSRRGHSQSGDSAGLVRLRELHPSARSMEPARGAARSMP